MARWWCVHDDNGGSNATEAKSAPSTANAARSTIVAAQFASVVDAAPHSHRHRGRGSRDLTARSIIVATRSVSTADAAPRSRQRRERGETSPLDPSSWLLDLLLPIAADAKEAEKPRHLIRRRESSTHTVVGTPRSHRSRGRSSRGRGDAEEQRRHGVGTGVGSEEKWRWGRCMKSSRGDGGAAWSFSHLLFFFSFFVELLTWYIYVQGVNYL